MVKLKLKPMKIPLKCENCGYVGGSTSCETVVWRKRTLCCKCVIERMLVRENGYNEEKNWCPCDSRTAYDNNYRNDMRIMRAVLQNVD